MTSIDLYLNWSLLAIYGRMGEADTLMRACGPAIRSVAHVLSVKHPIDERPIYRGMLLDPSVPFQLDKRLTFMSWSEHEDVARWFACTRSTISEPLAQHNPKLRGFIAKLVAPRSRVLFHHSWADAFGLPLEALARLHPFIGRDGARQIEWSVRTQGEVITEPIAELPLQAIHVDDTELALLERALTPPFVDNYTNEACGMPLPCPRHNK